MSSTFFGCESNATWRPIPLHPSIAQTRSGQGRRYSAIALNPARSVPHPPPPTTCSSAALTSLVTDRLCGSIPTTTRPGRSDVLFITAPNDSIRCGCRAGRAPLLRAEQTPLEPLPALDRCLGHAGQMRATRLGEGSRCESDDPDTWTEPRQAPVLRSMKQVAEMRMFSRHRRTGGRLLEYCPDDRKSSAGDWSITGHRCGDGAGVRFSRGPGGRPLRVVSGISEADTGVVGRPGSRPRAG